MEARAIQRRAAFILLGFLAAGCASGSSRVAAETVMVSAATKSEAASTFHIAAIEQMDSLSGTPFIPANGATLSGDVDLSTRSAHLRATMTVNSPKPGAAPQDLSFESIEIGSDTWTSTDGLGGLLALGSPLPPGHWIKDDSSSSVSQFPDPAKLFDALKSKATTVRFVRTGRVDGVECDEYQLQGPASLLDSLGGGSSDQSLQTGPVSIQVWLDRSHLVRRLSTAVKENMGDPGQIESVKITVDFTDYGEHLHIDPPPANLIVPNN